MQKNKEFNVKAELCTNLSKVDLQELCEATEEAILAGGGFGWVFPPANKTLQDYWKGVLLIPERVLIVGKLDNIVAGSVQLIKPAKIASSVASQSSCKSTLLKFAHNSALTLKCSFFCIIFNSITKA